MNLLHDQFIFIDCQTTGANPAIGSLLEIAWCAASAKDASAGDIYCSLVKQPSAVTIPYRVQALTGITDADMSNALEIEHIYGLLKTQLAEISSTKAIAHYASFERPFLLDLFVKHGEQDMPFELICTYQIAKRLFPNLPTRGIRGLGGFFGSANSELKRSSHHVEMTWHIWQGLVKELDKHGLKTIEDLSEWLKEPVKVKRTKYEYPLEDSKRLTLPNKPGIYKMLNMKGEVLYVGKATSLKSRVNSYFRGQTNKDPRKLEMLTQVHDIGVIECGSVLEAALMETDAIKMHDPPYNISLKRRQRELAFFSHDLLKLARKQSVENRVGPFSGPFAMEQLLRIQAWQSSGELDPLIFYNEVSDQLIEEGFALFKTKHALSERTFESPRNLLAFAIKLFKKSARSAPLLLAGEALAYLPDVEEQESADVVNAQDDLDAVEVSDDARLEELTAEDVSGKFSRGLQRSAKAYLRSKMLTRLLNCRVIFTEGKNIRTLIVCDGETSSSRQISSAQAKVDLEYGADAIYTPWAALNIITYDRLSVLLAEIIRMRTAGISVIVEPELQLKLISHAIV